jgi:hypothetical protein
MKAAISGRGSSREGMSMSSARTPRPTWSGCRSEALAQVAGDDDILVGMSPADMLLDLGHSVT